MRQAEDRAHRQGQKLPVNVYFLCAKGTSDDRRCETAVSLLQHSHLYGAELQQTAAESAQSSLSGLLAACLEPEAGAASGVAHSSVLYLYHGLPTKPVPSA